MKKFIIITLLSGYALCSMSQQIEQAFINLPNKYIPLLTKEKRQTMISQYDELSSDTITNYFQGISELSVLDRENEYLKLKLTESSTFEMKIWNKKDSLNRIIGLTHTVCGPVCDSHIAFFSGDLNRIDTEMNDLFPLIAISDFLDESKIVSAGENINNIIRQYDILFTSISFAPDSDNVQVKSNAKEYLPEEIYKNIEPYIAGDKLELIWENGAFKKGNVTW